MINLPIRKTATAIVGLAILLAIGCVPLYGFMWITGGF